MPIGWRSMASRPSRSSTPWGYTEKKNSRRSSMASGKAVVSSTRCGPSFFTSVIGDRMPPPQADGVGAWCARKVAMTLSALKGSPLWNRTPSRSWNSIVSGLVRSQAVASEGTTSPSGPMAISASLIASRTTNDSGSKE